MPTASSESILMLLLGFNPINLISTITCSLSSAFLHAFHGRIHTYHIMAKSDAEKWEWKSSGKTGSCLDSWIPCLSLFLCKECKELHITKRDESERSRVGEMFKCMCILPLHRQRNWKGFTIIKWNVSPTGLHTKCITVYKADDNWKGQKHCTKWTSR